MPNYIKILIGIFVVASLGLLIYILLRANIISLPKQLPTPAKTGFNYTLPITAEDPTLTQAGAYFFFEGVVSSIKPQDLVVIINLNNAAGKSNTNKLEIPLNYKVKMTPKGGDASQTTEIQAKDIQATDNIKIDYNYNFQLKKLAITQVLVTR